MLLAIAIAGPGGASSRKVPPTDPGTAPGEPADQTGKPARPQRAARPPRPSRNQPSAAVIEREKAQEVRAQNQAQALAEREARHAARQTQATQRRAARAELINKRNEGNKESAPVPAPTNSGESSGGGSGSGQASAPTSSPGSSPAAAPQTGPGKTETPSKRGDDKRAGSKDRGKTKAKQRAASGGASAASVAGAPATPLASTAGGEQAGGGSNKPRSNSTDTGTPPTIVERVVHDIPSEDRIAIGVLAALVLLLSGLSVRERRRSTRTERDMLVDVLTGVGSRTALQRQLESEWKRAARHDRPLGLVLLDLDDLKQINDAHGHAAGDNLLQSAGRSISERVRQSDMVARLGGDEFVVVCPETSRDGLAQLADALQEDFRSLNVGVSVGFAEREAIDQGHEDLMARADAAMYVQKRASAV